MGNKIILERTPTVRLGDALQQEGLITEEQLMTALSVQKETRKFLGEVLVELRFVTEKDILNVLSKQMKLEVISLADEEPDEVIIERYKPYAQLFSEHNCIPLNMNEDTRTLFLVTSNPLDQDFFNEISVSLSITIKLKLSDRADIAAAINKYYGDYFKSTILSEMGLDVDDFSNEDNNIIDASKSNDDDAPMIKLVNAIFTTAVRMGTSDIHIEPLEDRVRVRYRVDGDLHEKDSYPLAHLSGITSRLKIMGGMNIAEKRKPQDGRITVAVDDVEYDVRVSILPTVYGEKVVMRLTNKSKLTMDKKNLGLLPNDERKFDDLLQNTNGIILVTGPTGSGKSTTLYTALSELNKENINITTIEDPVEANINGLNQVAINNEAGMTFPEALRCFLRQDPDIIMVGEIRDKETASLAIDAALTGHLVVSTLHTNSSISAISRLEKMGIEPYLLADAMCGVLAQRLVKRLCPNCKRKKQLSIIDRKKLRLKEDEDVTVYEPVGCNSCDNTGYKGRIAIYEILMFTKELKDAVADEKPIAVIEDIAIKEGLSKLKDSCIEQIKNGVTSIQEMDRVVHENSIEFNDEVEEEKEKKKAETEEVKEVEEIKEVVKNNSNEE